MSRVDEELHNAAYIGDGVYAKLDTEFDRSVWLCTSNGLEITNRICLEPEVLQAFQAWLNRVLEEGSDAKR